MPATLANDQGAVERDVQAAAGRTQYIIDFEGVRNYDWTGDSTFDQDYLTALGSALDDYALAYYEYDSGKAARSVASGAGCGGCGGGSAYGTSEFTFADNGSYSDGSGYDTTWSNRAVVERADGSYVTQYFDECGQRLGSVITDGDPSSGSPDTWATSVTRNSNGVVTSVGTPASVTAYAHSTGSFTTTDTAGLVRSWNLETTGETTGFALDQTANLQLNSSDYYEWTRTLVTQSLTVGDATVYRPVIDDERQYTQEITSGTTGSHLTQRAFTWHSGTLMVKEITVTFPSVSAANNGSATSDTAAEYRDQVGRVTWRKGEDGIIDYTEYDGGLVVKEIRDADTGLLTGEPWSSSGTEAHRVVEYAYDDGFQRETTQADDRILLSYRSRLADRRAVSVSYTDKSGSTYYGPISFSVTNHAGKAEATGSIAVSGTGHSTTTAPSALIDETDSDPLLAFTTGSVCRYSTSTYDDSGRELTARRSYFDIPASGAGTDGTHYDAVLYAYDSMGRQNRREEPHGTIYATTHDVLGRVTQREIGTDDSGTGSDNMVVTELIEYDGDADGGNSHVTQRTLRTTATSTSERVTDYTYDVRGRLLLTDAPTAPHTLVKYDNLGRELARGQYKVTAPSSTADPETLATNRMALTSQDYDERGRVCQSYVYNIDPADGSNDGNLRTDNWYDAAGRTVKVEGTTLTKTAYDRLGRQTHSFTLAQDNDSRGYAAADDVTGDTVLVESQTVYESTDSDDVVMTASIERLHDDTTTTGALDTNADADDLKYTAANIEGRIQITASWYDRFGRVEDVVSYGTYGGNTFNRSGLSVPTRSDTALRTTYDYNDDGERFSVTDAKAIEDRWGHDDLGRQEWYARNYEDETPEAAEPDKDQIVRYEYTDGLRDKYIADVPGATDQETTYHYGTAGGGAAGDSDIATGHLLHQVAYPDSTGATDRMTYAYNAQGQQIYKKDQDGTVIDSDYDDSGRLTSEVASALGTDIDGLEIGTDIDGAVRRKEFAYDGLGRMTTATQYDATTAGNVVDEFEYTYGEWGRMTAFASDVDSVVTGGTGTAAHDVSIDYTTTWAAAAPTTRSGARSIVPEDVTMPTGLAYNFVQESSGYHQAAGRTNKVSDDSNTLATFEFVGNRRVSKVELHAHDFVMDYADGASGGSYADWDRFNRIEEDEWYKDLATDRTILHREYTIDRGGFITEIVDNIEEDTSSVHQMDTLLTLDSLNRLTDLERGTLSGGSISNETMSWNRSLDVVGNITDDLLDWNADDDGDDTDEHDKDLTYTAVNEIDQIDTDDVVYSKSGMMVAEPRLEYVYDAWGRMVEVINASTSTSLAKYRRNALDHLIGEQLDREPDGDIDSNDYVEYFLCRPSDMGMLASFRDADTDALVERLWLGGLEWSAIGSFYSSAVLETRDDDYDGTLDRDTVLFIDRTGSVIGNYGDDASSGKQIERVFYNMGGQPFLMPWGDVDGDGDADSTDANWISTLWSFGWYDARADLDLDGDVDSTDVSAHATSLGGVVLSTDANSLGTQAVYSRYGLSLTLNRTQNQPLGLWSRRDPLLYVDGPGLYGLLAGNGFAFTDRLGASVDSIQVYGNHCGADHGDQGSTGGGEPVDDLDRACRRHDLCLEETVNMDSYALNCEWKDINQHCCDHVFCKQLKEFIATHTVTGAPPTRPGSPAGAEPTLTQNVEPGAQPGSGGAPAGLGHSGMAYTSKRALPYAESAMGIFCCPNDPIHIPCPPVSID